MENQLTGTSHSRIGRYKDVIAVLIKYGFEDSVAHTRFKSFFSRLEWVNQKRGGKEALDHTRYERIREVVEELGTTYIKFAQVLSNRHDVLPKELVTELEKLFDHVPPIPNFNLREFLRERLDQPPEEIFAILDPTPLASASIAQVHKGQLLNGQKVALKIRRPGIENVIIEDLAIMKDLATFLEHRFPQVEAMNPHELLYSFEKAIYKELDMINEAHNIERFAKNFEGDDRVYVPKVFREYCTPEILCMEYIEGIKITDIETLKTHGFDPGTLAHNGVALYFEQILEHGFFHADPHPGNFFVLEDGRYCLLDYGMMGTLLPRDRDLLARFVAEFVQRDTKSLIKTIEEIAVASKIANRERFEQEIFEFMQDWEVMPVNEVKIGELLQSFTETLMENNIRLPGYFFLLIRTFLIIEGIGIQLDPEYNMLANFAPYAERLLRKKLSPLNLSKKMLKSLTEVPALVSNLPGDVRVILDKVKTGKLHIEIEHKGLAETNHSFEAGSNRISLAIIIAALIIGSALITYAKIPPIILGIPLLGLIGFIISGFLGFRVVLAILKGLK